MQERIIILGAGVMQGPAIRIAKELGFFAVAVDGSAAAPCVNMADQFEQIDLKDKNGIEAFARSLANSGGLGGIVTAGTDFSATVAWVAERLGLPGIPYEAALNASDKARMRACFANAGLPSPPFITVTAAQSLEGLSLPAPFPLVVKPVDNMGGRGCRQVDNMPELEEALTDAFGFSRSGRAIIEAFIPGPEFSVDAIVYHGSITICGLADRYIFFPPYFIEMGHTMPTDIVTDQQQSLLGTFCAGVRALGLAGPDSIGAAKGDIKLSPSGPQIGEIAARLSGGYMSGWTYPYASGVEPIRAAILAAMGREPRGLIPLKNWVSAERAFISIPGTVQSISGTGAARGQSHIQELFIRSTKGGKVHFPENNVTKCGNVISAAPDRAAAVQAAESAARAILIRLDPADPETGEFLAGNTGNTGFPPDAFPLDSKLRSLLEQMPDTTISPAGEIHIISFPEFTASELKDYTGRSIAESLQAIRQLTGLSLPQTEIQWKADEYSDNKYTLLGKPFWAAFVRGGYQGAVYYIDRIRY